MVPGVMNINIKHARFCREYIIDHNGKAAAIRAGYSKKSAESIASRLLRNVKVKKYIQFLEQQVSQKLDLTAEKVIKELSIIGFANTTDFVSIQEVEVGKGRSKRIIRAVVPELTKNIDPGKLPAIAEMKQTQDGISIKIHDKVRALDLLGKHLGIFDGEESNTGTIKVKII